jgi:hypothetical protein
MKHWSKQEEETLKKVFKPRSISKKVIIAKEALNLLTISRKNVFGTFREPTPHRTFDAIRNKARRLGLIKKVIRDSKTYF